MKDLIAIAVAVAFIAQLAFIARFLRIPWFRTPEGRMTMANEGVLVAVLALAMIGNFIPDLPGRELIRFFTWSAIAAVFCWKTTLLYRRQAEGRRNRQNRDDHEVPL